MLSPKQPGEGLGARPCRPEPLIPTRPPGAGDQCARHAGGDFWRQFDGCFVFSVELREGSWVDECKGFCKSHKGFTFCEFLV